MTDTVISVKAKTAEAQRQFKNLSSRIDDLATSAKSVAIRAGAAFAGLSAGILGATKVFGDFQNDMTAVKTLLDDTAFKDIGKSLDEGFRDLSKNTLKVFSEVPISLDAATKSMFDLVSAGVPASKATKVLGEAGKLAVAGVTDVSTATDGLTSVMNAYGFEADQANTIAGKFFLAQKAGKTTIAELAKDFGKVGAATQAMGVSFDETLAAVSAMTKAGIQTNQAYTGLAAVLSNISKPSAEAKAEAERLGIGFDIASLEAKGLSGVLEELATNNKVTKDSIVKLFGSIEAQKAIFALTGQQFKDFQQILGDVSDDTKAVTSVNGAAEEQSKTLNNQLILLKNNFTKLGVELGESFAPIVSDLASAIGEIVKGFSGLDDETKQTIAKLTVFSTAALGVVAGVAGFVAAIPSIVGGVAAIKAAFATLGPILAAGIASVSAFVTAALPWLAALVAAVGLLVVAWRNDFLDIQERTYGTFAVIEAIFDSFVKQFKTFGGVITSLLSGDWDKIKAAHAAQAQATLDQNKLFVDGLKGVYDKAVLAHRAANATIVGEEKKTQDAKTGLIDVAEAARVKAAEKAARLQKAIAAKEVKDFEKAHELRLASALESLEDEVQAAEDASAAKVDSFEALDAVLASGVTARNKLLDEEIAKIESSTDGAILKAEKTRQAEAAAAKDIAELREKFAEEREALEQRYIDMQDDAAKANATRIDKELAQVQAFVGAAASVAASAFDAAFNGVKGVVNLAIGGFADGLGSVAGFFAQDITAPFEALDKKLDEIEKGNVKLFGFDLSAVDKVIAKFARAIPKLIRGFAEGIGPLIQTIASHIPYLVSELAPLFVELTHTILQTLPYVTQAILDSIPFLIEIIPQLVAELLAVIPVLLEQILAALPEIITMLLAIVGPIVKQLADALPGLIEIIAVNLDPIILALVEGLTAAAGDVVAALITSLLVEGGLERIVKALIYAIPRVALALVEGFVIGLGRAANAIGLALEEAFDVGFANIKSYFNRYEFAKPEWIDEIERGFRTLIGWIEWLGDIFSGGAFSGATEGLSINKIVGRGSQGGLVPRDLSYFQNGAFIPRGTDTVPAMLTPGERVLSTADNQTMMSTLGSIAEMLAGGQKIQLTFKGDGIQELIEKALVEASTLGTGRIALAVGSET